MVNVKPRGSRSSVNICICTKVAISTISHVEGFLQEGLPLKNIDHKDEKVGEVRPALVRAGSEGEEAGRQRQGRTKMGGGGCEHLRNLRLLQEETLLVCF